jgi:hypothetical protein
VAAAWEQEDVFPAIARVIDQLCAQHNEFATHAEITAALLADAEGAALVQQAREATREDHAAEWIAHNMVAWFSQRISVAESDWTDQFDRVKIDNKWAYKTKRSNDA